MDGGEMVAAMDAGAGADPVATAADLSAAGLVWWSAGGVMMVALVHRARDDAWTLPTGMVKAGEAPESAAERKVREETGWLVRRTGFAGHLAYVDDDGRPKVVLFWHMAREHELAPTVGDEMPTVHWLSRAEAIAKLSLAAERHLLECVTPPVRRKLEPKPKSTFHGWRLGPERHRLLVSVETMRSELGEAVEPAAPPTWLQAVRDNL